MSIRILLADDHTILRAGLKMMLNAQPDMEVVGEAQDGRQAFTEAQRLQPDVVLMDITMPDINGIEATKQIKKILPDVRILMLTMHEHDEYVFQALRAGASFCGAGSCPARHRAGLLDRRAECWLSNRRVPILRVPLATMQSGVSG